MPTLPSMGVQAKQPTVPKQNYTLPPAQINVPSALSTGMQSSTPAVSSQIKNTVASPATRPNQNLYNPITDPNKIQAGMTIHLPTNAPFGGIGGLLPSTAPSSYVVQPGDTLTAIGHKFNISPQDIMAEHNKQVADFQSKISAPQTQVKTDTTQTNSAPQGQNNVPAPITGIWVSPTGAVIDTTTGKVVSGPTNQPPSVDGTTGTGGSTPIANPATGTSGLSTQDMSYGGLIQQLLQRGGQTAEQIQNLQTNLAGALGQNQNRAIPLEFQTGRAQVLQNVEAQREQALQQQLANQKGLLGTAISATAPVSGAAFFRNPVTGELVGGGSLGEAGGVLGRLAMAQKLPEQKAGLANAQGLKQNLQNLFQSTGINPTYFSDVNNLDAFLHGKVGDPKYAALSNLSNQYVQVIANILGVNPEAVISNVRAQGADVMTNLNNLYNQAQNTVTVNENAVNQTNNPINPAPVFTGTANSTPSTNKFNF